MGVYKDIDVAQEQDKEALDLECLDVDLECLDELLEALFEE